MAPMWGKPTVRTPRHASDSPSVTPPDDIGIPGLGGPTGLEAVSESVPSEPRRMAEGPVLFVWALLTVAAVVYFLWHTDQDYVNDPVQKAARGEITGLGPLSLVREDNLRKAFAVIAAAEPDGRVTLVDVQPTDVEVDLALPNFVKQSVNVDAALHLHRGFKGETTDKGLPIKRIDPAAPERFLSKVNARTKTAPTDLDRIVISIPDTNARDARWALTLTGGIRPDQRDYTADRSGHDVKGVG
jgi:hypothetical protein